MPSNACRRIRSAAPSNDFSDETAILRSPLPDLPADLRPSGSRRAVGATSPTPFTETPPILPKSPSVYTSHFCDASGEHLTFLYGKYLTSSTEALEAVFPPLPPIAGARIVGWRRLPAWSLVSPLI